MCSIDTFKIDLKGLKESVTTLEYSLDNGFFEAIGACDVQRGELHTEVTITKVADFFRLCFHTTGMVHIPCDLCLDDMDQPIDTTDEIVVKFGAEYREDDEVIIVAEDEGILDTAWLIYEFIALNIPIKHVHAPGKCNPAMRKMLAEHDAARSSETDGEKPVDPRWSALLKLTE